MNDDAWVKRAKASAALIEQIGLNYQEYNVMRSIAQLLPAPDRTVKPDDNPEWGQ